MSAPVRAAGLTRTRTSTGTSTELDENGLSRRARLEKGAKTSGKGGKGAKGDKGKKKGEQAARGKDAQDGASATADACLDLARAAAAGDGSSVFFRGVAWLWTAGPTCG